MLLLCQEFFGFTQRGKRTQWAGRGGVEALNSQGLCFELFPIQFCERRRTNRNFTQERLQKFLQSNACRWSDTTSPAAFFLDVKIIPA